MKLKPYAKYKDSGVEWLGHVPADWTFERANWLFTLMDRPVRLEDEIVTAFRDGTVTLRKKRREDGFTNSVKEIGYQGVRSGDLVIHVMDAFAGAVGVSDSDGKCTPVYSVCTPRRNGILPVYYGRLLRHMALSGFIASLAKGIRERSTEFRYREFSELILPVPPEDTQSHIAAFLDRETAKIDILIAKQEKLIELLKEKRQAVISRAATKGLDANVPMKPSGVEWLGEVPEHWAMLRVKFVSSFITSGPRGWSEHLSDHGHIFLQSGDLNDDATIDFVGAKRVTPPTGAEGTRTALERLDVVVCITGANTGRTAVVNELLEPAYINQHLALIRPAQERLSSTYLAYWLASYGGKTYFETSQYGLKEGLSLRDIAETPLPIPSLPEQLAIVEYLHTAVSQIDLLVRKADDGIALNRERRAALITSVVTGKVAPPPSTASAIYEEAA